MATIAKNVNYTEEQTAALRDAYLANPTEETVKAFAEKFGKTTRSIVAKLSRLEIYKKKEYVSKTGEKPQQKAELVDKIAELAAIDRESADCLEKATKQVLVNLLAALKKAE